MLGDSKIGVIIPPKEIRAMIDKTAEYVAKNGSKFEETIYNNQSSDEFAFLRLDNPYRAYYDKKVVEFARQMIETEQGKAQETIRAYEAVEQEDEAPIDDTYRFISKQPELTIGEKDLIIITAQYVALNGEEFLSQLSSLERENPNYVFLRPNHPHFGYFTNLVDMYIEMITNIEAHTKRLLGYIKAENSILKEAENSIKAEETQKKHMRELIGDTAKEQNYIYELNNFRIVETIDFDDKVESHKAREPKHNPEFAFVFNQLKNKDNLKKIKEAKIGVSEPDSEKKPMHEIDDKILIKCELCGKSFDSRLFDSHMKEELKKGKGIKRPINVEKDVDYSTTLNKLVEKRTEMFNEVGEEEESKGFEVIEKPAFLKHLRNN